MKACCAAAGHVLGRLGRWRGVEGRWREMWRRCTGDRMRCRRDARRIEGIIGGDAGRYRVRFGLEAWAPSSSAPPISPTSPRISLLSPLHLHYISTTSALHLRLLLVRRRLLLAYGLHRAPGRRCGGDMGEIWGEIFSWRAALRVRVRIRDSLKPSLAHLGLQPRKARLQPRKARVAASQS